MRQGDDVGGMAEECGAAGAAHRVSQREVPEHGGDRQATDRDHQFRSLQLDLARHPTRAGGDLARIRHAVATRSGLAGEAAADRGDVDARAHGRFIGADAREPAEEGAPRRPRERSAERAFTGAGRLPDQVDA